MISSRRFKVALAANLVIVRVQRRSSALHDRRRVLLRHPLLPGHRIPPRHSLARRTHSGRRRQPVDTQAA